VHEFVKISLRVHRNKKVEEHCFRPNKIAFNQLFPLQQSCENWKYRHGQSCSNERLT